MTPALAFRDRLPGLECDPAIPPAVDDTIRLDVAGFVGFAERGPVDEPVPVEDPAQYRAIFGDDLVLALDDRGTPIRAALPSAVRSFFDNGGRRAFVVRVARRAATATIPARVTSRTPLGHDAAVVALTTAGPPAAPLAFEAASPGRHGARLAVDITVRSKVLATRERSGTRVLSAESLALLEEGDSVLLRRGSVWHPLDVPADATATFSGVGGLADGDVVHRLRLDLTVHESHGDGSRVVERQRDLRLGPGRPGDSRPWSDAVQEPGAASPFRRDRSMYLRALSSGALVARIGGVSEPVGPEPMLSALDDATLEAVRADGLAAFEPLELFLDDRLLRAATDPLDRITTVYETRTELEQLVVGAERPRLRGVHALALTPEVRIVAVPDLYHRPWALQTVLAEEPVAQPAPKPTPRPIGFRPCEPEEEAESRRLTSPVQAVRRMVAEPPAAFDDRPLHAVSAAVAVMCAARADQVAVLGLPHHAGPEAADALADVLRRPASDAVDPSSHVGIWHPWASLADHHSNGSADLRPVPPVGAVAGTIAATELERGWWVEPAGRPLAGFVDAETFDRPTTVRLFDRGYNPIRRTPAGFVAVSAHTVSSDPSLLQLSVRRLLIWVRLLALREGDRLVFEVDDERLRARVRAVFRRHLERLRVAGALVAYEVDVEPLTDRSASLEGRMRIELRLAPSSPIEFVTVTLVRSGEGLLTVGSA